jgi:phosphoglycerate kinase
MANTFLLAGGSKLGRSLVEPDRLRDCETVLAKARARDVEVVLPTDLRVGSRLDAREASVRPVADGLAEEEMALDIGPVSERRYAAAIAGAATVFWNGPMGVFENEAFARGTLAVAEAVADCPGYCVVGGGDSVAAVNKMGFADRIDHVSTGGGASLEMVEGRTLPGIQALGEAPEADESEESDDT